LAQVRSPKIGKQYTLFPVAWWDGECEDSRKIKLVAFREFRNNGKLLKITINIKRRSLASKAFATVKRRNLGDVFARL
jgi:hypothetical protein